MLRTRKTAKKTRKHVIGTMGDEKTPPQFEHEEIELDDLEELEEIEEITEDEPEMPESIGIVVTTQEPVVTFRSGREVLRSGGIRKRIFSPETHGTNWREVAEEFIATCKTEDGQRRPKFIKSEDY